MLSINVHQHTTTNLKHGYLPLPTIIISQEIYNIYHIFIIDTHGYLVGGFNHPSEKYEWKSVGMMKFPTEWKKMFQTTNQIYIHNSYIWYVYIPDGKTTHTLRKNLTISPCYRISHILMISTTSLSINTRNQLLI